MTKNDRFCQPDHHFEKKDGYDVEADKANEDTTQDKYLSKNIYVASWNSA
jgi:hypothetical protein